MENVIKEVRQRALIDYLQAVDIASTQELIDNLKVSPATVRRDLDELAELGLITRVFGGAKIVSPADPFNPLIDDSFDEVLERNQLAKTKIANLALNWVKESDTIFLEAGTTCFTLAKHLPSYSLTVATNSLRIAEVIAQQAKHELIVLGGTVNREYLCTQGPSVLKEINKLQLTTAFLGCSGVSKSGIIRDTDALEAQIKIAASHQAERTVVLADHSKFPGQGAYMAIPLAAVDAVITDEPRTELSKHFDTEVIHQ